MTVLSERFGSRMIATQSRTLAYLPATAFLLDLVVIALTMVLAVLGRRHLGLFDSPGDIRSGVVQIAPLLELAWLLLIAAFGGYRASVFGAGTDEFKRLVTASLYTAGILGVTCYLAKLSLSRGFFALAFVIGVPALILGRYLLRRTLHAARTRGILRERVLMVGSPDHVDEIAAVLGREKWLGYSVVGALTPNKYDEAETLSGVPVLGHANDVAGLPDHIDGVDILFFCGGGHFTASDLRQAQWALEEHEIQIVVAPSLTDVSSERIRVRPVGGLPLMHLEAPRWAHARRWAKRTFDVAGSICLLIVATPVFLWAALWIKVSDAGPIFFRQTRTGRDGTEFSCLKFRTMVVDAEARLAELHRQLGHTTGLFKMKDDPRITRPGKLLRRLSFDELPQLINVLRGDMSLVGPRPPLPSEVHHYDLDTRRRLRVRPGMTGLWQVSGRSDLSWEEAIRLDLYYVDNWSMLQDLSILFRTFGAVLGSKGAY